MHAPRESIAQPTSEVPCVFPSVIIRNVGDVFREEHDAVGHDVRKGQCTITTSLVQLGRGRSLGS